MHSTRSRREHSASRASRQAQKQAKRSQVVAKRQHHAISRNAKAKHTKALNIRKISTKPVASLHKTATSHAAKKISQTAQIYASRSLQALVPGYSPLTAQQRKIATSKHADVFKALTQIDPQLKRAPTTNEFGLSMLSKAHKQFNNSQMYTTSSHQYSTLSNRIPYNNKAVKSLAASRPNFIFNFNPLAANLLTTPVFYTVPVRHMATAKKKPTANKKGGEPEEEDPSDAIFMSAGDVKKQIRNWLEQIFTSKPEVLPLPPAAIANEELFVQECQQRFAKRLDRRTRYEQAKIIVKQRAIEALPAELKDEALKEDESLWNMQIIQPWSHPPRKKWLYEHFQIPYKPSLEELEEEEFMKKKYARF